MNFLECLPQIPLLNILNFLHPRELRLCRCVSKGWRDRIDQVVKHLKHQLKVDLAGHLDRESFWTNKSEWNEQVLSIVQQTPQLFNQWRWSNAALIQEKRGHFVVFIHGDLVFAVAPDRFPNRLMRVLEWPEVSEIMSFDGNLYGRTSSCIFSLYRRYLPDEFAADAFKDTKGVDKKIFFANDVVFQGVSGHRFALLKFNPCPECTANLPTFPDHSDLKRDFLDSLSNPEMTLGEIYYSTARPKQPLYSSSCSKLIELDKVDWQSLRNHCDSTATRTLCSHPQARTASVLIVDGVSGRVISQIPFDYPEMNIGLKENTFEAVNSLWNPRPGVKSQHFSPSFRFLALTTRQDLDDESYMYKIQWVDLVERGPVKHTECRTPRNVQNSWNSRLQIGWTTSPQNNRELLVIVRKAAEIHIQILDPVSNVVLTGMTGFAGLQLPKRELFLRVPEAFFEYFTKNGLLVASHPKRSSQKDRSDLHLANDRGCQVSLPLIAFKRLIDKDDILLVLGKEKEEAGDIAYALEADTLKIKGHVQLDPNSHAAFGSSAMLEVTKKGPSRSLLCPNLRLVWVSTASRWLFQQSET